MSADIQKWREGMAAIVTIVLVFLVLASSLCLTIAAFRWALMDDPGSVVWRALVLWFSSYVALNLWSLLLRKLNRHG